MNKIKIVLFALVFTSVFPAFASNNIFDKMDKETSVTTGIYKLSSQEKLALINWLDHSKAKTKETSREVLKQEMRTEIIAEIVVKKQIEEEQAKEIIEKDKIKNMGFRKEESERMNIQSSIIGDFNGWQGKNIFKLENGQIWKQAEKTTFYIPKRSNPKITIKPKSMGSWSLYVDGFGRGVKVKRIK